MGNLITISYAEVIVSMFMIDESVTDIRRNFFDAIGISGLDVDLLDLSRAGSVV